MSSLFEIHSPRDQEILGNVCCHVQPELLTGSMFVRKCTPA